MYSRVLPSWRSWKEPPLISTPSREQEPWGWASNGIVFTPLGKRPKTKDTRQRWGLRWHPMVIEGRREAGELGSGGLLQVPSVCLLGSVSKLKL